MYQAQVYVCAAVCKPYDKNHLNIVKEVSLQLK